MRYHRLYVHAPREPGWNSKSIINVEVVDDVINV